MSSHPHKDFVTTQQKLLLPGWRVESDDVLEELGSSGAVVEKALKTLSTERQREAKAKLSSAIAQQVGLQLEALQEDRVEQKLRKHAAIAESGSLKVNPSEPRWTNLLPPEWPNAHSKAEATRYKEQLQRIKELQQQKIKLEQQRYVYRSLDARLRMNAQNAAEHVPHSSGKMHEGLATLTDLLRQSNALPEAD